MPHTLKNTAQQTFFIHLTHLTRTLRHLHHSFTQTAVAIALHMLSCNLTLTQPHVCKAWGHDKSGCVYASRMWRCITGWPVLNILINTVVSKCGAPISQWHNGISQKIGESVTLLKMCKSLHEKSNSLYESMWTALGDSYSRRYEVFLPRSFVLWSSGLRQHVVW